MKYFSPFVSTFIFLMSFTLLTIEGLAQSNTNGSLLVSTDRYEFYSNFWINMHHFLYKKAEQANEKSWQEVFEDEILNQMNNNEREILSHSIQYYQDHLTEKSLLFDDQLYWTKRALIKFGANDVLDHESINSEHQQVLNNAKSVYANYFWKVHHNQNRKTLDKYLPLVKKIENRTFNRIESLAKEPWPEEKIRVDLSYYSNWAGAYTTTTPIHVVLTSLEEGSDGEWAEYGWLELLFHEPSHGVITNNKLPVADTIKSISEELDVKVPRDLWHAVLFYFSGKAVQEALRDEGIEYELMMITYDIFSRYHAVVFEHMPPYVRGNEGLETALRKAIIDWYDLN